jgi:malate permease and related proteins
MTVLLQIGALFALMAVGFALGKLKLVESPAIRGMSNVIVKASLPALIVMSLQRPFSRELAGSAFRTLGVATAFYAGIIALSIGAGRLFRAGRQGGAGLRGGASRAKSDALAFGLSFSNAAFIGFPVITSILGEGALFLTSIHNILFNLTAFTVGIIIISGKEAGERTRLPIKSVFNINVLAAVAGFALFMLSVTLPRAVSIPLGMLGSLTTPLAMVVTGAMLARTKLSAAFGDWRIYAASALRLVVWPAIAWVVLSLVGIEGELKYITTIVAGMPSASNTSLLAEVYGGDADTASSIVCMTTLLSVATIPIMATLLTR